MKQNKLSLRISSAVSRNGALNITEDHSTPQNHHQYMNTMLNFVRAASQDKTKRQKSKSVLPKGTLKENILKLKKVVNRKQRVV